MRKGVPRSPWCSLVCQQPFYWPELDSAQWPWDGGCSSCSLNLHQPKLPVTAPASTGNLTSLGHWTVVCLLVRFLMISVSHTGLNMHEVRHVCTEVDWPKSSLWVNALQTLDVPVHDSGASLGLMITPGPTRSQTGVVPICTRSGAVLEKSRHPQKDLLAVLQGPNIPYHSKPMIPSQILFRETKKINTYKAISWDLRN